ncbi:unnamed protein product [Caenorhabditis auriculariae]|uniref:Uncharacterized protein n=1 Tax=Caenorhabditis auriculariae TaxID=2777116 RepID=A0A8S1HNJ4_9PELO|nr:unnamed protein product [Caenorhabditis auriculariae]
MVSRDPVRYIAGSEVSRWYLEDTSEDFERNERDSSSSEMAQEKVLACDPIASPLSSVYHPSCVACYRVPQICIGNRSPSIYICRRPGQSPLLPLPFRQPLLLLPTSVTRVRPVSVSEPTPTDNLGSLGLPPLLRLEQRRFRLARSCDEHRPFDCRHVVGITALAITVPFLALKELLEKRTQNNIQKHLGRRRTCRVSFGSIEDELQYMQHEKKLQMTRNAAVDSDDDVSSVGSAPPLYDDLFHPPPPSYQHHDGRLGKK